MNIFGSRNALKHDFQEIIELFRRGEIDPLHIVTNEYRFEDAATLFFDFDKNANNMLKVLVRF